MRLVSLPEVLYRSIFIFIDMSKRNEFLRNLSWNVDRISVCEHCIRGDVQMVNTCLPNFEKLDRKSMRKCKTTNETDLKRELLWSVPAITKQKVN